MDPIFECYDIEEKKIHKVYKFDNGWGVSIAQFGKPPPDNQRGGDKPGCWAFAVIYWTGGHTLDYEIHYNNPIYSDDILLNVPEDELTSLLHIVSKFNNNPDM